MSCWLGRVVSKAWAYAQRSGGIWELCCKPTWRTVVKHISNMWDQLTLHHLHAWSAPSTAQAASLSYPQSQLHPLKLSLKTYKCSRYLAQACLSVHHWVLNSLAREEGSESDWVCRCIQLWEIACGGEGEGDYMDVVLAFTISVKNCSLQTVTAPTIASLIDTLMEWIQLVNRDGGH